MAMPHALMNGNARLANVANEIARQNLTEDTIDAGFSRCAPRCRGASSSASWRWKAAGDRSRLTIAFALQRGYELFDLAEVVRRRLRPILSNFASNGRRSLVKRMRLNGAEPA